jgi:adenylate cyclase
LPKSNGTTSSVKLAPQCLACGTALSGTAGLILRAAGISRSPRNPNVCNRCNTHLEEGAIVEITVLFADLSGFTALSGALGPEQTHRVVDLFLRRATDALVSEGATIDKYIGDAVMAFFNVPVRQPDHALRALRAALKIQSLMPGLSRELGMELRATAGVASGYARLGKLGSSDARDYTAIGDVVNLSSRLQGQAMPGEVLLDASSYVLIEKEYPGVTGEELQLKGVRGPAVAHRFGTRLEPGPPTDRPAVSGRPGLGLGAVAFALLGAPCAASAVLGPLALALGVGSAAGSAAAVAGPHVGLDSWFIRLPLLAVAATASLLNLAAALHARRALRRSPERAGMVSAAEHRKTRWVISLSLLSLAIILGEFLAHSLLMHHPLP